MSTLWTPPWYSQRHHLSQTFSPTQIGGLVVWLKADAIVGLVNNDPVGTWSDSSGNGNNATQATASLKPLYKTNQINGLPAVQPDGVDDLMGGSMAALGTSALYIIVTKDTADAGATAQFNAALGVSTLSGFGRPSFSASIAWNAEEAFGTPTFGTATGTWYILTFEADSTAVARIFTNGTQQGADFDPKPDYSGATAYKLFADGGGVRFSPDPLAEKLLYTPKPSAADRTRLHRYLGTKYGITVP